MTKQESWSWLHAHLGEEKALSTLAMCEQHQDKLEAIVVVLYHASDPRRQQFRQAVRTLIQSEKV